MTFGLILALSGTARADYYTEVAADNPVIWYKFNESAGAGTATNIGSAGANYNTAAVNTPTFGVASAYASLGTAVDLHTNGHFDISGTTYHYTTWLNTGNKSLEFWIKTTDTTGGSGWNNPSLMGDDNAGCCGGGSSDSWWGVLDENGGIGVNSGNDPIQALTPAGSVADGNWHHLVMSRDGSNNISIYLDGNATAAGTGNIGGPNNTWDRIGQTDGNHLDAVIDEVAIYNTALTGADAARHYNATQVSAGATLFWDGDVGNWTTPDWLDDVPGTGTSTGTYPQNIATVINPANITEGTVTVNSAEEAYYLTMDDGPAGTRPGNGILNITANTLAIETATTISNTSQVNISSGATLDTGGTLQIDSGTTFSVTGIANAGTLAGTGTATLNATGKLKAGGGTLNTIALVGNAEVEAAGDFSVTTLTVPTGVTLTKSGDSTLDVTGPTALNGQIYNPTAGTLKFSGVVSDGTGAVLTQNGAATIELAADNAYTGATTVNSGILHATHGGALGDTSTGTTVNSGGQLRVSGGITVVAGEAIGIAGAGNGGAIYNLSGNNTIAGTVTMADADTTIHVEAGQLTISSLVTPGTGKTLTKTGSSLLIIDSGVALGGDNFSPNAGTMRITGVVTDGSGTALTKIGAGTMELTNNNTYTGATNVNAGILAITNGGALGTTAAGTTVGTSGQLRLSNNITVDAAETISINGASNGGALYNASGTNEVDGAVSLAGGSTVRVDNNTLRLDGGVSLSNHQLLAEVDGGQTLEIRETAITGSGNLRKQGDGTLNIRFASPAYTGTTIVNNGYVDVNVTNGLGTGQITAENDGTLRLRDGITLPNNVVMTTDGNGTDGAIRNENNTNTISGTVTSNNNNSRIHVNNTQLNLTNTLTLNNNLNIYGGGALNVTGQVTGGGQFNKNDGGTTTLANAANNFTGATNINAGIVNAGAGALSGSSTVTVASGATLNLAGGPLNDLVVNGDATASANLNITNLTVTSTSLAAGTNVATVTNSMKLGSAAYTVTSGDVGVSGTVSKDKADTLILGGTVTVTTPSVPVGHPTSGLLGMWTFDDGTAADLSGNGHDGSNVGSPTFGDTDTPYGSGTGLQSLDTNGGNNAILIGGNEADFDTGDELTVVAWVKERPDGGWEPYISKRGESNGWQVRRHGNNSRFSYTLRGTTGHDDNPVGTIDLGDNNGSGGWIHVVARYDGTTNQLKQLIANGNVATPDLSQTDTGNISNTGSSVVFGARDNSNNAGNPASIGNWAHIKLDDVFIYDRWLSDAEVATIYNGGAALPRESTLTALVGSLSGAGTIDATGSGGVEIDAGGNVSPGASTGTINVTGDMILGAGYSYDWEYDNGTTLRDLVNVSGDLELPSTATINAINFDGDGTLQTIEVLFDAGTLSGETDLSGWTVTGAPGYFADIQGTDVVLMIPEPSTLLLAVIGLLGLLGWRRRRRR